MSDGETADDSVIAALEAAQGSETWAHVRELVEVLMDQTEGARAAISELERSHERTAAACTAHRGEAARAAKEKSTPVRAELSQLHGQIEVLRRSLSDDARKRLEIDQRVRKEEARLQKDIDAMRADISRLRSEHDTLTTLLRERLPADRDGERGGRPPSINAAQAPTPSIGAPPTGAAKLTSDIARPLGVRNAVPSAPSSQRVQADAVVATVGGKTRLDSAQRQRLDALKAKYGEHVAERAAGRIAAASKGA